MARVIHRLPGCLAAILLLSICVIPAHIGHAQLQHAATPVIFWSRDSGLGLQVDQQIANSFNKANPTIHVTVVQKTSINNSNINADPELVTAVRSGTGPDLYWLTRPSVNQYAAVGLLQPLTPYMGGEDLSKQYLPFSWNEVLYHGQPYGLPLDTDARTLYYNKTLLRQAGVNPNLLDPSHGPITINELHTIAFKLNKTDSRGNYTQVGFLPSYDQGFWQTWSVSFGGSFYDAKSCKVTPTNPGVVQSYQLMYDWAKQMGPQKVASFLATYNPSNAPPAENPFYTGRLAMVLSGNWQLATIAKYVPNLDYGITYDPVPQGKKIATWSAGFSMVMPTGAKHPQAAYQFMRYMAGPIGQRILVKEEAALPTWAPLLKDKSLFTGSLAFYTKILPYSTSLPVMPVGAFYFGELFTAQDAVTLNQETPLQALTAVDQHVQPRLQPYCGH